MFPYCRRKFLGAETTSYQTFAQVFLLHLIYDVGWSISPTYTPQNPMIDHHFPHEDGPGLPMSRCHVRQNHWSTSMVFSPKIEYPRNHCFSPIKHHHLLKDLDDLGFPMATHTNWSCVDQERCEAMALSRDRQMAMLRQWIIEVITVIPHLVTFGDYWILLEHVFIQICHNERDSWIVTLW